MAKKHVEGVAAYFKGEQWLDFLHNHLVHPDEDVYHAHLYADSSVHPDSLKKLMFLYFEAIGHPLTRRIDPVSPHPGQAGLHSVYPEGLAHFDMYCRWNPDAVLEAMPPDAKEAEHGYNALSWGKKYQDDYLAAKNYRFKTVGPSEDKAIENYFLGKHWKETLDNVLIPEVVHCHSNVEICFDPKILEIAACKALAKVGWTVERVIPCVYDVHGVYTGKIVFLLGHPEEVFDICWKYNPDVVIRRASEPWIFPTPGFDLFMIDPYLEVLRAADFYVMTDEEIAQVAATF